MYCHQVNGIKVIENNHLNVIINKKNSGNYSMNRSTVLS